MARHVSIFAFISIRSLFVQSAFDFRVGLHLDASLGVCFGLRLSMPFGDFSGARLHARFLLLLGVFSQRWCLFYS